MSDPAFLASQSLAAAPSLAPVLFGTLVWVLIGLALYGGLRLLWEIALVVGGRRALRAALKEQESEHAR